MLLEAVWSVFNHGVARVWSWCGQVWLGCMWCVGKHVGSSKFHGRVEFHGNELTWRWPFLFTIGCYVMIIFHWNLSHIFPKIPQTQIWPGSDVTSNFRISRASKNFMETDISGDGLSCVLSVSMKGSLLYSNLSHILISPRDPTNWDVTWWWRHHTPPISRAS